ncbi:MAG: hypothetical protein WCJ33_04440, partial [Pseudomonadota bacterium]
TKSIKTTTKKAKEFGNKLIHGRNGLGPNVIKLLKQYGDILIIGVTVFRHALASPLVTAIDALSGFQFKKNIEASNYDQLFHLGMQITLQGNIVCNLEKTEVISLTMSPKPDATDEFLVVSDVPENLTLNLMLEHCKEKMGANFYTYASASNNCQDFTLASLQSNYMNSQAIIDFVKQNTLELFENTGVLNTVANTVTDLAGRFDILRRGGSLHHGRNLNMLHYRTEHNFNRATSKVFHLMSISGKYRIVGSANIADLMYCSDYDMNESEELKSFDVVYHSFKTKFKSAKNNKDVFITDFKAGVHDGKPLRWTYDDIMKGNKTVDNVNISFEDAIKSKGLVKLDCICIVGGKYLEFSDIYYFRVGGVKYYEKIDEKSVRRDLKKSMHEEYELGNWMKFSKRVFSLAVLDGKKKLIDDLCVYFNGPTGFMNKQLSDLKIIELIMKQTFRKPKIQDIDNNLQSIKQNLSFHSGLSLPDAIIGKIDMICDAKTMKKKLQIIDFVIGELSRIINKDANEFLLSHHIII